ncbi:hypothetical protein VYU27_007333, partial [Nannochloropsis oceanica]
MDGLSAEAAAAAAAAVAVVDEEQEEGKRSQSYPTSASLSARRGTASLRVDVGRSAGKGGGGGGGGGRGEAKRANQTQQKDNDEEKEEEEEEEDEDDIRDTTPFLPKMVPQRGPFSTSFSGPFPSSSSSSHGGMGGSYPHSLSPSSSSSGKRVRFSTTHHHHEYDKQRLYGLVPRTWWQSAFEYLYGQVPEGDLLPMISFLSGILFVIIGGFWLLDSLKDTVFASIVGLRYQPWAKFTSVLFTLFLTLAYNHLVDRYSKPTLFYLVGGVYT